MKNRKIFCIAAALMLALLAGCTEQGTPTKTTTAPTTADAKKTSAPDFTVYDLEGNSVTLSDFKGTPVVLNFWASWCGPCKREMPEFEEACTEYSGKVQFLMVNLTDGSYETVQSASEFISGMGYTFPVYYDTDGIAGSVYGITSIPTTFFIDAEGYIAAYASGTLDGEALENGIGMILP